MKDCTEAQIRVAQEQALSIVVILLLSLIKTIEKLQRPGNRNRENMGPDIHNNTCVIGALGLVKRWMEKYTNKTPRNIVFKSCRRSSYWELLIDSERQINHHTHVCPKFKGWTRIHEWKRLIICFGKDAPETMKHRVWDASRQGIHGTTQPSGWHGIQEHLSWVWPEGPQVKMGNTPEGCWEQAEEGSHLIDTAVPNDSNMKKKHRNVKKYQGLKEDLEELWKRKITVVPVVIRTLP